MSVIAGKGHTIVYSSFLYQQAQYIYIHDALSEYITCGDTSFPLMDAHTVLRDLNRTQGDKSCFLKQFEVHKDSNEREINCG